MFKIKPKVKFGMTLIELLVTLCVIAILASITTAKMSNIKPAKDLVEEATDLIVNSLGQANATSIAANSTQDVWHLLPGTTYAQCDANNTDWKNVNGTKINKQVTVKSSAPKITYSQGLVYGLPNNYVSYTIKVSSTTNSSCYNNITLWITGVIDIDRYC